jgi:hypothetical protein
MGLRSLLSHDDCDTPCVVTALYVFRMRDRFQVTRSNTPNIPAQVVDLHAGRDGVLGLRKRIAMREQQFRFPVFHSSLDDAVPFVVGSSEPVPASLGPHINFSHEANNER